MNQENPLIDLRKLAPKPSDAVKAMVEGLKRLPNDKFKIDMNTFGYAHTDENGKTTTCFGCAATCTLFQLVGRHPEELGDKIDSMPTRLEMLHIDKESFLHGIDEAQDFVDFEDAMDSFRKGEIGFFFRWWGVSGNDIRIPYIDVEKSENWYLRSDDYKRQLSKVEAYLERMILAGL